MNPAPTRAVKRAFCRVHLVSVACAYLSVCFSDLIFSTLASMAQDADSRGNEPPPPAQPPLGGVGASPSSEQHRRVRSSGMASPRRRVIGNVMGFPNALSVSAAGPPPPPSPGSQVTMAEFGGGNSLTLVSHPGGGGEGGGSSERCVCFMTVQYSVVWGD